MTELAELVAARRRNLERLRANGLTGFPHRFDYTHRLADVVREFESWGQEENAQELRVCGRLVAWRDHGKSAFGHLEDATGKLQVYFRKDAIGEEAFSLLRSLDVGDFIGVHGRIFRTKTGELTLKGAKYVPLAKSLRPPPEKWHGLKDKDIRYRHRHIDLQANSSLRDFFRARARAIQGIRDALNRRDYVEVETPVLQPLYGGAEATPFTTRYESLDTTYYLRISNELYLKRLIAGGMDRVYEFSKDFRNEGIDRTHVPEFTLLELYEAYADYRTMMDITEELVKSVCSLMTGGHAIQYQDRTLDLSAPWPRLSFIEELARNSGLNPLEASHDELRRAAAKAHIATPESYSRPKLLDKLFSVLVQDRLDGPTFVTDHPLELSPLAKAHRDNPKLAERFELIIAGIEIANAFSELNDPDEQRRRFEAQSEMRRQGDSETHALDEEFISVLEQGMPPAGGLGIGIDRLMMIVSNTTAIRDVIIFPQLRPDPA